MPKQHQRIRWIYALLVILTIGLGLASRSSYIPDTIYPYLGDVLYATMFFFIIGFITPQKSAFWVMALSIIFCISIEISQLIDIEWLNNLRANRFARLILGSGFLWSDIICYIVGGILGLGIELSLSKWIKK